MIIKDINYIFYLKFINNVYLIYIYYGDRNYNKEEQ
jgi:hypothetical protein